MRVKVEQLESGRAGALRIEGETSAEAIGLIRGRLLAKCAGLTPPGPPFGLLLEGPAYEACWPAPAGMPLPEGLIETTSPGGYHAIALHEGGYDTISDTLGIIVNDWLPHSGFCRREGPILHRYLTDPRETPESGLRTEVCLPVSPDPIE